MTDDQPFERKVISRAEREARKAFKAVEAEKAMTDQPKKHHAEPDQSCGGGRPQHAARDEAAVEIQKRSRLTVVVRKAGVLQPSPRQPLNQQSHRLRPVVAYSRAESEGAPNG